jgi:hypothetical protein
MVFYISAKGGTCKKIHLFDSQVLHKRKFDTKLHLAKGKHTMTPSQKKAINGSKTMQILVQAMQDGAEIVFRCDDRSEVTGDVRAQVRTHELTFDWIVSARGRIIHEDYSIIPEAMREKLAS